MPPSGWWVSSIPAAGELAFIWRNPEPAPSGDKAPTVPDPERSAEESARRARRTLRRYCVANSLDHLWTLTYRPEDLPDDEDGVWRDIERFRRRVRARLGDFPLAAVIERGTENDRLHVHVLVKGRQEHSVMAECWGRGFVQFEKPPRRTGKGKRARLRASAAYLTKYVGKEFDDGRPNRKRYSTTRGFQPVARTTYGGRRALFDVIRDTVGSEKVAFFWQSDEEWRGPPLAVVHLE